MGTYHNAEEHGEHERADGVAAEDEDAGQHQEGGERCHDGTAESLVERLVDRGEEVLLGIEAGVLAHTVEHHHRIVDLVTDHGEDSGDEALVDLHSEGEHTPEDGVDADDREGGESHGGQGAQREGNVAEAEQDVEEHGEQRQTYGDVGFVAHVVSYGRAYGLRRHDKYPSRTPARLT